ncbi:MAG: hypothetical protein EO766_12335 [Hydrotalea sp. AMD]|uniref:hypothetical protein n=1 Tax=Hydrotalea sp. AMD TaxID=2501297 RepID=UPI0010250B93|nr:hypothetical protein [Hydrotalea sp. AMD]RWZ87306.1 MAG: hypothetical protein EO766_12335 [Hydrotalea sp. AMD]
MSNVHQLIRNAQVKVSKVKNEKGHDCAHIEVNGQYEHTFPPKSRVTRHLDVMTPEILETRLDGGTYFFVEDQLVDWRDGHYNGFIHTDGMVDQYMELLGYVHKEDLAFAHRRKLADDKILLRSVWDKNEIIVPGYVSGGEFHSELSFVWNPFVTFINSSFDLVRLICTNGMVGVTSFLNTKIPLLNRQTEHLDIAARQIQNKVSSIVIDRVQIMADTRASVGQCLLLENHILERVVTSIEQQEHRRLLGLLNVVSPQNQLSHIYKPSVFDNKDLAAQLPSHITEFDAFNIATELRTHTTESRGSSDFSLDKFSNGLLFNDNNQLISMGSKSTPALATFSDPDAAFIGQQDIVLLS